MKRKPSRTGAANSSPNSTNAAGSKSRTPTLMKRYEAPQTAESSRSRVTYPRIGFRLSMHIQTSARLVVLPR